MKRYEEEQFSTFTLDRIVIKAFLGRFAPFHLVIIFIAIQICKINSSGASRPRTIAGGNFTSKILISSLDKFRVNEC